MTTLRASLATSLAVISFATALATGCSGTPQDPPSSTLPGEGVQLKRRCTVFDPSCSPPPPPPLVCATLPNTICNTELGYQIGVPSYLAACPDISLAGGGLWTPGEPGAGVYATRYPVAPYGGADQRHAYYDAPNPFVSSDLVCTYAYENARNADGSAFAPPGSRIDSSVFCGTLQYTKIAYIVNLYQCIVILPTGTTGGRGCDTCRL